MADIISQLNLTEKELKENEKVLQEIVKTIDKIENSKGINITDRFVKEFNTDRDWITNMKGALEDALNNIKIRFGVDIVVDDKIARQINEKMQKQFGKGPDLDVLQIDFERSTTKSQYKENIRNIKKDFDSVFDYANGAATNFSLERILDQTSSGFRYDKEAGMLGNIKGSFSAQTLNLNELRGKGYEIVNEEEKVQKAQTEVVNKAVEERERLKAEGLRRSAENAKKDQSAGTWTPEELEKMNKARSGEIEELKKYKKLLEDTKNFNFDAYNDSVLTGISLDSKIKEVDTLISKMNELKSAGKNEDITKMFTNFVHNDDFKDYTNALYELNADAIKGDVTGSIKNVQNEILDLVNSIAEINIEDGKVTKFEWAIELADELKNDTKLLDQLKERLISIYQTYYSSSNSINMLSEFGTFRAPNEIYRGFKISEKDKSEDVIEAGETKRFFEENFETEGELKKYIEDYKKLDEEIKKISSDKKLTDDEKTDQINNLIGRSGIDIDGVKEYIKALNQIKRFDSYQGKEVKGTSALLEKLKNDKDEMEKSRSLLEYILGTSGEDTKNVNSYLKYGKPLAENVNLVDRDRLKVNENITKQEQDSIKASEQYQKSISDEQNRLNSLIDVLNRVQDVKKNEAQLNRDLSIDEQVNLWNQDLEVISKAENEVASLSAKINEVHNKGLINTTQLDILPSDLHNIKTVLSTNYGAGFDADTLDRVQAIRDKYTEILQIKDSIIDDTRSEAGQEELVAKTVNSIKKANKEREEAQKNINSNRGQYESSLEENTRLVEGYTNSINKLKPIYEEFQKKYREGLKAKGTIDNTSIDDLTNKYSSDIYKRIGLDKLEDARKKAQNEVEKIRKLYLKAGEALPTNHTKNIDLIGINTYADNLIRVARINEMRQSIAEKLNSSEAKGIDKLKEKMEEYKKQLQSLDAPGLDKIIQKLEIYQKEFDNAIKKGDITRARNVFGYFEQQFSPVRNIQNGQKIAANKRAEAEKAAADAAKKAQKEQADAQKALEERLNNLKSKVKTVTDAVKSSISTVISIIRKANTIVNKFLTTTITGFEKFGSTVKRLISIFGNFGNRITNFNKQGNILKGTFTELKSKIDLVVGAFSKLFNNSFISEGKNLLSSIQTMNMLIGTELTDRTIEWANNLERGFGLSANSLITDLKGITAVMYGLGMQFDHTQKATTNLEAIALGLSATTGYDFETVIGKIESGMKGMTQSIDDLGLSVRESQMDAFLKKLKAQGGEYANINTHFSQLEESQRVYVRLAAIMDQYMSKEAFTAENYAKSLDTITGRLSILSAQMRGLKSDIGNLALQLFDRIIDKLIVVISLVRQFIGWLAKLFNIDLSLNSQMNKGQRNDIKPIEDKTDALEKEADAADKAKGSLDSLDHVSTMSESKSSKSNDGSDFDYSKLIDFDDYAGLLEKMAKEQENYIDKLKKKWKDAFTDLIKKLTGRDIDWSFIEGNLNKVKRNIENTIKNIGKIVKNFGRILLGLIWSIGDDLDFSVLLAKFTRVISLFTQLVATILEKIQPYIQKFYDKYLSPYVQKFGDWCEKYLDKAIVKLSEWIAWWENDGNNPAIQTWFDNLGEKFEELVKWIGYIKTIFKGLFGMEENEKDLENLKNMPDWLKNIHDTMADVNSIFRDFAGILGDVLVHILDFNKDGQLTFDDVKFAIEKIKEKLDKVSQWVNDNKENITLILTSAWDTLSKLAELKFTIIETLIKILVENADTVSAVLRTIQDIIDLCIKNPKLAIAISIGGLTLGKLGGGAVKTLITAAMWKKMLGLGAGGTAAKAAAEGGAMIANEVAAGVAGGTAGGAAGGAAGTAAGLTLGGTLIGLGAIGTAATVAVKSITEAGNILIDGAANLEGIVTKVDEKTGNTVKITAENTKTYAYEIRRALTEAYGSDIDTSKAETAFKLYAEQIQKTFSLTDEETEYITKNIERQYNRMGSALDGAGATFAYSTNSSKNNIQLLADKLTELDSKAEGTASKLNENADSVAKKTEEIKNTVTTNWDGIRGAYTTTTDTIKQKTDEVNTKTEETKRKTDELKTNVQTNWDGIRGVYTTSTDEIKGKTDEVTNNITESMSTMTTLTGESLNTFNQTNFKTWEDVVAETSKASTEIKGKTNDVRYNVTNMSLGVKACVPNITSFTSAFMSSFSALNDSIGRICEGINQKIGNMFQNVVNQTNNANNIAQQMQNNNNTNTNWNPNRVRNFGYANGGTPKSGSIFYANENGNTELVGNFGGYSGVANQGMIIQAMQGAMVNAIKSSGRFNGGQTPNITINVGNWMGDEAGIRKLAREVQNSLNRSNSTIANTSFSMS